MVQQSMIQSMILYYNTINLLATNNSLHTYFWINLNSKISLKHVCAYCRSEKFQLHLIEISYGKCCNDCVWPENRKEVNKWHYHVHCTQYIHGTILLWSMIIKHAYDQSCNALKISCQFHSAFAKQLSPQKLAPRKRDFQCAFKT